MKKLNPGPHFKESLLILIQKAVNRANTDSSNGYANLIDIYKSVCDNDVNVEFDEKFKVFRISKK